MHTKITLKLQDLQAFATKAILTSQKKKKKSLRQMENSLAGLKNIYGILWLLFIIGEPVF